MKKQRWLTKNGMFSIPLSQLLLLSSTLPDIRKIWQLARKAKKSGYDGKTNLVFKRRQFSCPLAKNKREFIVSHFAACGWLVKFGRKTVTFGPLEEENNNDQ